MNNYEFRLTPAYCLFNGVGIKEQSFTHITFLLENPENKVLKERLIKAFSNHIGYIRTLEDCPEKYRRIEEIEFEKGTRSDLRRYVSSLYVCDSNECNDSDTKNKDDRDKEAAAVLLLENIISEAREKSATDIHIEKAQIRYRVQGKLIDGIKLDPEKADELVRRIKLLSGMNVLETNKSQDGQFCLGNEKPVYIRVSTMSVVSRGFNSGMESVVLRLLDTSRIPLSLSFLGFDLKQIEQIENLLKLNNGLIVICGPTGSGKSTTAASMLLELSKKNKGLKIISMEDPPEYYIPDVTQIRIDPERNNSFTDALHHVFRQDPDVIMIGEIRDRESCETAIRASLTGHLVIATLHTQTVHDALFRLENLGGDLRILDSVLKGIIIQNMNIYKNTVNLLADVSIPNENFVYENINSSGGDEIEFFFDHYTNFLKVLNETVGRNSNKKDDAENHVYEKRRIKIRNQKVNRLVLVNKNSERKEKKTSE